MSGEFGSYLNGYFHTQIEQGAADCLDGRDELTRLWGAFLSEFAPISRSISYSEACDSGPDDTIIETIDRLPQLRKRIEDIEKFLAPYRQVMREAVRRAGKDPQP